MKRGLNAISSILKGSAPIQIIKKGLITVYEAFKNLIVSGTLPISLPNSIGRNLVNYKLEGKSVQNGTPAPDNPVEIESVGEKTKNLYDMSPFIGKSSTLGDATIKVESDGRITGSGTPTDYIGLYAIQEVALSGNVTFSLTGEFTNITIQVDLMDAEGNILYTRSLTTNYTFNMDDYPTYSQLRIYIKRSGNNVEISGTAYFQIEQGTVVTDYEPYGYKIPVISRGKNLLSNKLTSVINASGENENGLIINGLKPNTTYSVSYKLKDENVFPTFVYVLNTLDTVSPIGAHLTEAEPRKNVKFTTLDTIEGVTYYIGRGGAYNLVQSDIDMFEYIQVEEGSEETTYEPYIESIATNIYLDEPLRKVGGYADYIDFENRQVVRNIEKYVVTGEENWILGNTGNTTTRYYAPIGSFSLGNNNPRAIMSNYLPTLAENQSNSTDAIYCSLSGNSPSTLKNIRVYSSEVASVEELKTWLAGLYSSNNPLELIYALAEPSKAIIDMPNIPTFKGTTVIDSNVKAMPSNVEIEYLGK